MDKRAKDDKKKEEAEIAKVIKEFQPFKQQILDKLINGLLKYVREDEMPKSNPTSFMDCYNIIYNYTDKNIGEYLLNFHNEIIQNASIECYEKIKNLPGADFIDYFISCTDKLNTLIFNMSRIFQYISNNYLKSTESKDNKRVYEQEHISEFSMDIYKKYFFDKLEAKLFNALNEILIREERNGNMEHRLKITTIMKTLTYLDFMKPEIVKYSATKIIWNEKSTNIDNKIPYQHKWYDNYFKQETTRYVKNKSERDIKNNSAPEYVKCELKYINEEYERQNSYINAVFHNDINDINYAFLIKNNMNAIAEMDTGVGNMFQTKKRMNFQKYTNYLVCFHQVWN